MQREGEPNAVQRLQALMVEHGRWLDTAEAEDLYAEVGDGLPEDRCVEEAMARSRPLTDEERRKLSAAGMKVPSWPK